MELAKNYAEKWEISSQFIYEKNYYQWMSKKVKMYKNILEVGCGVGYGTLALAIEGHNIIAIDKNVNCILMAKRLIHENCYDEKVQFLEGDIILSDFRNEIIEKQKADAIICWNPGTYMDSETIKFYLPFMTEYGLTLEQIKENISSSYAETMLWHVCRIAKAMAIPVHIIDRCGILEENDKKYYEMLCDEIGFSKCQFDYLAGETISEGGVPLIAYGEVQKVKKMQVKYISALFE